jgi:transforming growth factor-beta-induced protein
MRKTLIALLFALATAFGLVVASQHEGPGTIVDVAIANEDFNVLVDAVVAADLVETLSGEGPFTVFAPTDEAFAAALEALGLTAEELLASEDLVAILTYHVVPGLLMAADVLAAVEAGGGVATVETVHGATITVEVVDGNVVLNGVATVILTDVEASNGVIHVIDAVILPPEEM